MLVTSTSGRMSFGHKRVRRAVGQSVPKLGRTHGAIQEPCQALLPLVLWCATLAPLGRHTARLSASLMVFLKQ